MVRYHRESLAAGRDAAIAARIHGRPMPPCPFGRGSKRALYWQWGVERAERLLDQIEAIG